MRTLWNEIFKIKLANTNDVMAKHEVIKLLIVKNLIKKHGRKWIRIYTEFPAVEGKLTDVYFENTKTKEAYAFEIQRNISKKWLQETHDKYEDWEASMMDTSDWILMDTKKLSNNINELNQQIKELIP